MDKTKCLEISDDAKEAIYMFIMLVFGCGFVFAVLAIADDDFDMASLLTVTILYIPIVIWLIYSLLVKPCYYVADEAGISVHSVFGKRRAHFAWSDFKVLALRRGRKMGETNWAPVQRFLVLSCSTLPELPEPEYMHNIDWYWRRHSAMVGFIFTEERYEFIRQYCDLPLSGNKKSL